ncbi:MAG: glycosyl transferase family protein [Deltaproteobacteria bacterium]|nr:glycosyl transferase family protein [Deltaproteobacteria bacterium]
MADALDLAMRLVAYPVCGSILVNGIDDMFIDANYYLRGIFKSENRDITVEALKDKAPQRIAMMVPAWQEAEVIQQMLELNLKTLDYPADHYDIFVGTYQNDKATQDRVDHVARRVRNVHKVVVPHDGPTMKADALNWVYQSIQLLEERRGQRFDILLMHDAEDIIHPLAMRLYNYLLPDYDFVQTPVFPLEMNWNSWVANTYKDEFCEHHLKDMLVREQIGGLVPSAGVGSGFAREAFEEIAVQHSNEVFNTGSLTEDYEIGMKFRLANKKTYFACRSIKRSRIVERGLFKKRKVRIIEDEYIATREFFPDSLRFAVRQRSRWVLGIAMQGWEQIGWKGTLPVLYCLYRDRKALFTNYMSIFAYVLAAYCVTRLTVGWVSGRPWTFDNIFAPGSILWWLVMGNTLILTWRALMKYLAVDRIYGPLHGFLTLPRFFVSNVINFAATSKALKQYINHKITGEPLRWLKTEHAFPSVDVLRTYQRRLGELLMDREGLSEDQIQQALELQGATGLRLGEVFTMTGMVSTRSVADALADQLSMPVVDPDPYSIPLQLLRRVPEADSELWGVLPLSFDDEHVDVAVGQAPESDLRVRLEELLGAKVRFVFAAEGALRRSRERAYRRILTEEDGTLRPQRLGQVLKNRGLLTETELHEALEEQGQTGELLGELLVRKGWVKEAEISRTLAQRHSGGFRTISAAEADPDALRTVGYGLCALYGVVPLNTEFDDGALAVAASGPVHDEVLLLISAKLGTPVRTLLAPALDVRSALAAASNQAWPDGIVANTGGLDGCELQAISADPDWGGDLESLAAGAVRTARAPIDYLLAAGGVSADMGARLRARAMGVALAGASRVDDQDDWLPPGWALRGDIQLLDVQPGALVVAAPHPTPSLAREVATLFPDHAIAWRVAPYSRSLQEQAAEGAWQSAPAPTFIRTGGP